ncbi:winged helix-turn-helix transcriptional regulator [Methanogenium marinum]|uniref:Winged helix-turn-helix transcriptional regulator n=1 Tax=Methanogenium marinum TaxID=348610 RepID=A0A9Q4KTV0_9EURY|nr:winged helix-turn-helix transcriptional regulator [Methanogenium marinum]MDE4908153.1 winged helix-turn-helix transcriptional regulator [Methanogenium marinum]
MISPRLTNLVLVLLIVTVITPAVTAVETGGYVVEPAYDIYPEYSDVYFTPRSAETILLNDPEPTPIRLADLPSGVLVILGVAAVTPGVIYLGKYLSAANLPIIGGFKRVTHNNILDNTPRKMICSCVKENPGIQLSDLKRSTGFSYKNLSYHLNVLTNFHVIKSEECKNTTRYFENSGKFSDEERAMLMYLSHSSDKKIIETVLHHPGISRREISSQVGISGPSVSWHMHFLLNDRIIEQRKEGRVARHYLTGDMSTVYDNMAGRASV